MPFTRLAAAFCAPKLGSDACCVCGGTKGGAGAPTGGTAGCDVCTNCKPKPCWAGFKNDGAAALLEGPGVVYWVETGAGAGGATLRLLCALFEFC